MTGPPADLDRHRGMGAQKATEIRRLLAEVEADQQALQLRQEKLEEAMLTAPAKDWHEVAKKVRYLILLLAGSPIVQDPRRATLIQDVLTDLERLDPPENR